MASRRRDRKVADYDVDYTSTRDEHDDEVHNDGENSFTKAGYDIARLALLNGGRPLKRKAIRDLIVKHGFTERSQHDAAIGAAKTILIEQYGLKLFSLANVALPQHSSATRDEYILTAGPLIHTEEEEMNDVDDGRAALVRRRKVRKQVFSNASIDYVDMMCVLNLSLAFLVLEPGGLTEDNLVELLAGTGLFGAVDADEDLIKYAIDRLVSQRLLDLSTQPGTEPGQRLRMYNIGPSSLACVGQDSLLNCFVRLMHPTYKGGAKTPDQDQTIEFLSQRLEESVFRKNIYS